jgi:hypothetical protein
VSNPRILIVTPEITYLPEGMGNMAQRMHARIGAPCPLNHNRLQQKRA